MFFEEEKSTTNITFEVDKKRATVFEYFLESLDMTPAEAFDEMLGVLASKVGNKSGSKESKPFELKSEDSLASIFFPFLNVLFPGIGSNANPRSFPVANANTAVVGSVHNGIGQIAHVVSLAG